LYNHDLASVCFLCAFGVLNGDKVAIKLRFDVVQYILSDIRLANCSDVLVTAVFWWYWTRPLLVYWLFLCICLFILTLA